MEEFTGLLKDKQITLRNLLVSGVTVGLEVLLSTELFDCPVNHHKEYGTAFLVAPVFIVFFANLVVLGELSMLTDRVCMGKYYRWGDCGVRVTEGIVKALFGPSFWLIASFADTTYYVCIEVGQAIEKRNLTNETEIKILQEKFAEAKRESHVWAWVCFAIVVFVTAFVIIAGKCALKDIHLAEDRFSLERREAVAAMIAFHEGTRDLDEEKEVGSKTSRRLEKYKEIKLYPDGAPEQRAQKRVKKLLANRSEKDDWNYLKAYEEFAGMYPRVASGKPWDPWVSDLGVVPREHRTSNTSPKENKTSQEREDQSKGPGKPGISITLPEENNTSKEKKDQKEGPGEPGISITLPKKNKTSKEKKDQREGPGEPGISITLLKENKTSKEKKDQREGPGEPSISNNFPDISQKSQGEETVKNSRRTKRNNRTSPSPTHT